MRLRLSFAFFFAALAPGQAIAAGAAVGQDGETVLLDSVRVAVAVAPGRTTLWAQVSVSGASAGFVWIVPVRPGGRVDLGSDAWLDALDAATAPVVIPPPGPVGPGCDAGSAPEVVAPGTSPQSTKPGATGIFYDVATLTAFVRGAGCALPQGLASTLGTLFAAGSAVVASTYSSSARPTRTLRIVDGGPAVLPFLPGGASAYGVPVTAFVVASASATAGASPLLLDPKPILWGGAVASTYVSERDALLLQWQGTRWLTESAMPGISFDGVSVGSLGVRPAVVSEYFQLATAYGDVAGDPAACAAAAYATRNEAGAYAALCPDGALGVVAGAGPCACAGDGGEDCGEDSGVPVDALVCGSANDAALAVASLAANSLWISRIDGRVTPSSASDVPVSIAAAAPASPVVPATGYAPSCQASSAVAPPPIPSNGGAFWTPPPSSPSVQPVGGYGAPGSSSADAAPAVAEGCGAAVDACGSSGDPTSDGTGDGSGGCSSSDPPSDGSDGSGGCGSSSPSDGSSSGCAAAGGKRGRGRSPVSRVLVGLVAAAAIGRRRTRARS